MILYFLIFLEFLEFVLTQDSCQIQYNGAKGICKRYSYCNSAQLMWNNYQTSPTFCPYNSFDLSSDPLVCCELESAQLKTSTPPRRSQQECRELYNPPPKNNSYSVQYAVGGLDALPGEFPFMVALGWPKNFGTGYSFLCGGFLIAKNYVLTAAHCTNVGGSEPTVVLAGGNNLKVNSSTNLLTPIVNITVHPEYDPSYIYNDIAVIKLKWDSWHKPACLWPLQSQNFVDVIATGYGHTTFAGSFSNILQKVQLKIFPNQQCSQYYTQNSLLPRNVINSQICAGDLTKKMDTCQGDSGGPLFIIGKHGNVSIPFVLGITSIGQICADGSPSIYTRVSSYLDWIESIVWPVKSV